MRSLKQIRESYDFVPRKLVLEAKKDEEETEKKHSRFPSHKKELRSKQLIPSTQEMPPILMFRRITYKVYPNKQVIALYYAKSIDKYLSVPFGPGGNVNLHEARIVDLEEAEEFNLTNPDNLSCEEALRVKINELRLQRLDEITDAQERQNAGISQDFGAKEYVPGYVDQKKASGNWKKGNYGQALKYGARSAGKKIMTAAGIGLAGIYGAGALAGGSAAAAAGKAAASGVLDKLWNKEPEKTKTPAVRPTAKTSTSGKIAKSAADAVYKSKLKAYDLGMMKQPPQAVKENKMSDIRSMLKEGVENKDLTINGRTVTINTTMAKRILEVYDSVNTKNKKIVESMLNTDLESFKKLLKFSIKAQ